MDKLTPKKYHQQKEACDGLCVIDEHKIPHNNPNLLMCVRCPFCKQIVNAILSDTHIKCPACKVQVKR